MRSPCAECQHKDQDKNRLPCLGCKLTSDYAHGMRSMASGVPVHATDAGRNLTPEIAPNLGMVAGGSLVELSNVQRRRRVRPKITPFEIQPVSVDIEGIRPGTEMVMGRPCERGHSGLRYKKSGICWYCQRDRGKRWRDKHAVRLP